MFSLGKTVKFDGKEMNISPLEYIILAHLRKRELENQEIIGQYGNEMIRELNKLFEGVWEAQSGTIYPILSKMEDYRAKNLLKGENKKSELGPAKKVYTLTDNGRDIINRIIIEKYEAEQNFLERYGEFLKSFKEFVEMEKSKHAGEQDTKNVSSLFKDVDKKGFPCPACKTMLVEGVAFCYSCGAKVDKKSNPSKEEGEEAKEQVKICPHCNIEVPENATFCAGCGGKVNSNYQ